MPSSLQASASASTSMKPAAIAKRSALRSASVSSPAAGRCRACYCWQHKSVLWRGILRPLERHKGRAIDQENEAFKYIKVCTFNQLKFTSSWLPQSEICATLQGLLHWKPFVGLRNCLMRVISITMMIVVMNLNSVHLIQINGLTA